jgi:hypothetical protein
MHSRRSVIFLIFALLTLIYYITCTEYISIQHGIDSQQCTRDTPCKTFTHVVQRTCSQFTCEIIVLDTSYDDELCEDLPIQSSQSSLSIIAENSIVFRQCTSHEQPTVFMFDPHGGNTTEFSLSGFVFVGWQYTLFMDFESRLFDTVSISISDCVFQHIRDSSVLMLIVESEIAPSQVTISDTKFNTIVQLDNKPFIFIQNMELTIDGCSFDTTYATVAFIYYWFWGVQPSTMVRPINLINTNVTDSLNGIFLLIQYPKDFQLPLYYNPVGSIMIQDCIFTGKKAAVSVELIALSVFADNYRADMERIPDYTHIFEIVMKRVTATDLKRRLIRAKVYAEGNQYEELSVPTQTLILSSTFSNCNPDSSFIDLHFKGNIVIDNSIFTNINIASARTLDLMKAKLTITNSIFNTTTGLTLNHMFQMSADITVHTPSLIIKNCTFMNNGESFRGAAVAVIGAGSNIQNSKFINNYSITKGGALNLYSGLHTLNETIFESNFGIQGGAIFVDQAVTFITNCVFRNNSAYIGGALFASESRMCSYYRCEFENNVAVNNRDTENHGGAIYQFMGYLIMSICSFTSNRCDTSSKPGSGGAMYLVNTNSRISGTMFELNSAYNGGAVFIERNQFSLEEDHNVFFCGGLQFHNNTAIDNGGAVYLHPKAYLVIGMDEQCLYLNEVEEPTVHSVFANKAKYGGAFYIAGSLKIQSGYEGNTTNIILQSNHASIAGGAFHTKQLFDRYPLENAIVTTVNNFASFFGSNYSTDPMFVRINNQTISVSPNEDFNIEVIVVDGYDQIVKGVPDIAVSLLKDSKQPVELRGEIQRFTTNGTVVFKGISVVAPIYSSVSINAYSSQVENAQSIQVNVVMCHAGYKHSKSNISTIDDQVVTVDTCSACIFGTYNLVTGSSVCHICPTNAQCQLDQVATDVGYWANLNTTSKAEIFPCNSQNCIGNNDCSGNRDSSYPICTACLPGYSEWAGRCLDCKKGSFNAGFFFIYLSILTGILLFNHVSSQVCSYYHFFNVTYIQWI